MLWQRVAVRTEPGTGVVTAASALPPYTRRCAWSVPVERYTRLPPAQGARTLPGRIAVAATCPYSTPEPLSFCLVKANGRLTPAWPHDAAPAGRALAVEVLGAAKVAQLEALLKKPPKVNEAAAHRSF